MLIESPVKKGDIVSFKLSSGEEVVGRYEEETDTVYKVSKPLMLIHTPEGIGFGPYMMTVDAESKITININNVIGMAKTEANFAKTYIEGTTGLKI